MHNYLAAGSYGGFGGSNLSSYLPLLIVALIIYMARRQGVGTMFLILLPVAGVVLAGSQFGPTISNFLSQVTGGIL